MSLDLDERRRAMLAEMGVRVFLPAAPAPGARDARQAAPEPVAEPLAHAAAPVALKRVTPQHESLPDAQPAARAVPASTMPGIAMRAPARVERDTSTLDWTALEQAVAACRNCDLCDARRNAVLGIGPKRARVLVVGDPPTEDEDARAEPFVGEAGKLLDNMLRAMGLNRREDVYLSNVLKCRPTGRVPTPEELAQCEPFLRRQVELLQPRVILAMGRFAVQALLPGGEPMGKLRGRAHRYNEVPVVVTFHPSFLIRSPAEKAKAWADLCLAASLLDE